ncbi:MAG: hypothetical protein ACLRFG_03210 [Clostridia bacterium]
MANLANFSDAEKIEVIKNGIVSIGSLQVKQLERMIGLMGENEFRQTVSDLAHQDKLDLHRMKKSVVKALAQHGMIKVREAREYDDGYERNAASAEWSDEGTDIDIFENNMPVIYATQESLGATNKEWEDIMKKNATTKTTAKNSTKTKSSTKKSTKSSTKSAKTASTERVAEPVLEPAPTPEEVQEQLIEDESEDVNDMTADVNVFEDTESLEEATKEFYGIPTKRNLLDQSRIRVPFATIPDTFAKKKHIDNYDIDTLEKAYQVFYGADYDDSIVKPIIDDLRQAKKDLHSTSLSKMKNAPKNFLWAARRLSSLCTFDIDIDRVNFKKIEKWAIDNKKMDKYRDDIKHFSELKERIKREGTGILTIEDKKQFAKFVADYETDLHKDIVSKDGKLKDFYDMYASPINTMVGGLAMGYLLAVPKNIASPQGAILLCMSVGGVPVVGIMAGIAVASIAINLGIKAHKTIMDNRKKRGNHAVAIKKLHKAMPRTRRNTEADVMNAQDKKAREAVEKNLKQLKQEQAERKAKKKLDKKNKKLSGLETELEGLTNEQIIKKLNKKYSTGNRVSKRVLNQANKNMLFIIEKASLGEDEKSAKYKEKIANGDFVALYQEQMKKALAEEREGKPFTDLRKQDIADQRKRRLEKASKQGITLTDKEDRTLDADRSKKKIKQKLNTQVPLTKTGEILVDDMQESALKQKLLKARDKQESKQAEIGAKQAKKTLAPQVKEHIKAVAKKQNDDAKKEIKEIKKSKNKASDNVIVSKADQVKTGVGAYLGTFVNGTGRQGRKDIARARLNAKEATQAKIDAVKAQKKEKIAENTGADMIKTGGNVSNAAHKAKEKTQEEIKDKSQQAMQKVINREARKVKLLEVPPVAKIKSFFSSTKTALANKSKTATKTKLATAGGKAK